MRREGKTFLCFYLIMASSVAQCFGAAPIPTPLIIAKLKENGYSNLSLLTKDKDSWLFLATRNRKQLQISVDPSSGEVKNEKRREVEIDGNLFDSSQENNFIDSFINGGAGDE